MGDVPAKKGLMYYNNGLYIAYCIYISTIRHIFDKKWKMQFHI